MWRSEVFEALEARTHLSVSQDANGWTVVTPSRDSHFVYVSSSTGNDALDGSSPTNAVKTIARARTIFASLHPAPGTTPGVGYPDWLLLKRGDTFYENLGNWQYAGRSSSEPFVITSYGGSTNIERPLLDTGTATDGFSTPVLTSKAVNGGVNHVYLMDIAFDANYRDVAAGTYDPTQLGGTNGFRSLGPSDDFLIEDCSFRNYANNVVIQNGTGSSPFGVTSNFKLRRNLIADAWIANSSVGAANAKAEGLYAEGVYNLTLDQNVFDHNGWNESVPGAGANIYNHDAYIYDSCTGVVVTGNIFANAGSHGLQARAGGIIRNNLFLRDAIAMSYGYVNGGPATPGGVSGDVSNNIVLEDKDISGAARGWGLEIGNTAVGGNTVVQNNIYSTDSQGSFPAIQLTFGNSTNRSTEVGLNDLTVKNNIVYSWAQGLSVNQYFAEGGSGYSALNRVSILNNDFQHITSTTQPIVIDGPTSHGQETWSGNRYDSLASTANWFSLGNTSGAVVPTAFGTWQASMEASAQAVRVPYPNPGRTVETYNGTLGRAATLTAFLAEERLQSKYYWRPQFAAATVASYVRAGFTVDTTAPTATATAAPVLTAGAGSRTITVTYTDNIGVDPTTISSSNLLVTGPNGYSSVATLLNVVASTDGSSQTATYSLPAPAGGWSASGNGAYSISVQASQVADTSRNYVPAGVIGGFLVNVSASAPTATAIASDVTDPHAAAVTLTVTLTDAAGIDPTTFQTGGIYVTGPGGFSQPATFVTVDNATAGTPRTATYSITTPTNLASGAANGAYAIFSAFNAALQIKDVAGAPLPADQIGGFNINVDGVPPVAIDAAPDIKTAGTAAETITVSYTDNVALNVGSVDSSDLRVEGPGGYDAAVTFVSATGAGTGASPLVAMYSLAAPSAGWKSSNNGSYFVVLQPNQVTDAAGNAAASGTIGAFRVAIDSIPPLASTSVTDITAQGRAPKPSRSPMLTPAASTWRRSAQITCVCSAATRRTTFFTTSRSPSPGRRRRAMAARRSSPTTRSLRPPAAGRTSTTARTAS